MGVVRGPPTGQVEQVQLKFVNTDLATFCGAELQADYDVTDAIGVFGNLSYIEATDRTRNGHFATTEATPGTPSQRVYGQPRGFFSGIAGPEEEPLPAIAPLTSRLGVRLRDPVDPKHYGLEVSTRLVRRQTRVAASLLESPTPGFNVWDLRTYWQATRHCLLIAGVENFTNANYREHLDFRSADGIQMFQPGINFYAGGEVNY
jgi:outer membrane receptor protein involved in Fe transport